jgi:HSP20 family protein
MMTNHSRTATMGRMASLNRVLDQALASAWTTDNRHWVPAIDVVEKKDAYVLYAELPGVDASQVEISFEQSVLTLRGIKPSAINPAQDGEVRVYAAERASGRFERSIHLPEFVDAEHIGAAMTDGVLTVTIPKAKIAQPRRIEINTNSAAEKASQN